MMKLYKIDTENVLFTGDLHGDFSVIATTINRCNLENCAIVVCGDIGIGFEKEEFYRQKFNHLTKTLKKKNIHLYMFRGNHDNKDFFDGEHFTEFEFIHIMPDYSVIQAPKRNILCIGGAISIDRTYRLQVMDKVAIDYMRWHNCGWDKAYENSKKFYWENEAIVFDENELKDIDDLRIKIDTVCTHTAPTFCEPLTKGGIQGWLDVDENLEEDLNKERKTCDEILMWLVQNEHPIKDWYYGHFHFHYSTVQDDIHFTLLDMARDKMDLV